MSKECTRGTLRIILFTKTELEVHMSRSFEPLHTGSGQECEAAMGDIVYLVKRPGYEFVLTVPTARPHCLNWGQTCFQVRLRDQHSGP